MQGTSPHGPCSGGSVLQGSRPHGPAIGLASDGGAVTSSTGLSGIGNATSTALACGVEACDVGDGLVGDCLQAIAIATTPTATTILDVLMMTLLYKPCKLITLIAMFTQFKVMSRWSKFNFIRRFWYPLSTFGYLLLR